MLCDVFAIISFCQELPGMILEDKPLLSQGSVTVINIQIFTRIYKDASVVCHVGRFVHPNTDSNLKYTGGQVQRCAYE
jgi:hypothetical protein